eukprot:1568848-Prymnesium_polylepis.1
MRGAAHAAQLGDGELDVRPQRQRPQRGRAHLQRARESLGEERAVAVARAAAAGKGGPVLTSEEIGEVGGERLGVGPAEGDQRPAQQQADRRLPRRAQVEARDVEAGKLRVARADALNERLAAERGRLVQRVHVELPFVVL